MPKPINAGTPSPGPRPKAFWGKKQKPATPAPATPAARAQPPLPDWAPREKAAAKTIRLLNQLLVAVGKINEFLSSGSGQKLVTVSDLKKVEKKIMAELQVVTGQLRESIASAKQTNADIVEVQKLINQQTEKIKELEKAVAEGGVSQEVADLVMEVRDLNKQADEALPNAIVIPPNPV